MVSIESALQEFLLGCEAEGLADNTVKWYRSILGIFARAHPLKAVKDVTPHDMRLYLARLRERSYSEDTVSDHTRALHRFWKWTAAEYDIRNPMRTIRYPQPPKPKKPKTVSLETVFAMFEAARESYAVERDQAILAFTLDSGCRAQGICNLRVSDLDLQRRSAFVTEKGSKTRAVVFTPVTAALIVRWMEVRLPAETLFYSLNTLEALTTNGLYLLFRRLAKRAEVKGRFNPHSFRHTFGKEYV